MKPIIPPIERDLLQKELTRDRYVRDTNYGSNKIYVVTQHNAPNVLREIGRLRELAFRAGGGGTGMDCDLDNFDTDKICYQQLVVWHPEDKEIVGGYRFILLRDAGLDKNEIPNLSTSHFFSFSKKFIKEYAPWTIELGRSFIQPMYQPSAGNRKGLFSLDNLWDGLGSMYIDNPEMKYFFGKVTMYMDFNRQARDMILYFMSFYFPDPDKLVFPLDPLPFETDISEFKSLLKKEMSYKDAYAILNQKVRGLGENIPPMFNAYMNLSPSMKTFGTAKNDEFGSVEETGIMVTIADIYPVKTESHITSYKKK